MANRITDEQKELINELYAQIGVKSQVAKIVGCSPSTVTKYLIPDYVSKADRIKIVFEGEPIGSEEFLKGLCEHLSYSKGFRELVKLTEDEKNGLEELKKEIF